MKKPNNKSFSRDIQKLLLKYSAIPLLLIFIAIAVIMLSLYTYSIKRTTVQNANNAASLLEGSVSAYLQKIAELANDEEIRQVAEKEQQTLSVVEELYSFTNSQPVGATFYVLDAQGGCIIGSSTILPSYLDVRPPYYAGIMYQMTVFPDETILMLNNAGNTRRKAMVLSIGRAIAMDGEVAGYLVFELDPNEVMDYISTSSAGELLVADKYYTALLTSKNSYLDKYGKIAPGLRNASGIVKFNGAAYYVSRKGNETIELDVYAITDMKPFYYSISVTAGLSLVLLLILLTLATLLSRRMVSVEASAIDRQMADIQKMQTEGIYVPLESDRHSEFGSLEHAYGQLIDSIRKLVEANKQEVLMRKTAEIKQLESQFNPHFIFNSLEVIRGLIKIDPAAANRMILNFSKLLRYSIDATRKTVTLKEDMAYIDNYLSIIRERKVLDINYRIELEEGTESCMIPKLCLQSLVENSVKYAIGIQKTLMVTVSAFCRDGVLRLIVKDNGKGIEPELLEQIRETLKKPEIPEKYFGLYNVNRRIQLAYGDSYGIDIDSKPGEGTTVTVMLPSEQEVSQ